MSNILELPEARARAVRWSVEDYEQYGEMLVGFGVLPKRAELIRGIIIEKMPESPLHVELVEWLRDEFRKSLPTSYRVLQEGPLRLFDSEPEPDISVVAGIRAELRGRHPTTALLVVEVAVTSVALDREYASMYAQASIPEYWIVLAESRRVEVRRLPEGETYQEVKTYASGEVIMCTTLADIRISVDELFG